MSLRYKEEFIVQKKQIVIKRPSKKIVEGYLKEWKSLENYVLQEESINLLFNQFCPENKKLEDILLKASVLNDFYSTNIFDVFSVAKHILNCNIDKDLKMGQETLVNEIARVKIKGKNRNFYSFSSKYCNHHNSEKYPIFDSYVGKMLWHFKKENQFASFKRKDLRDYPKFVEIIRKFRKHYGLDNFPFRDIDIYLWLCGKESFKRNYKATAKSSGKQSSNVSKSRKQR